MTNQLLAYSIISLVFTTMLLGFVLGIVVISYRKILERLHQLQQKELEVKEKMHSEAQKILDDAYQKAAKIFADADLLKSEQGKVLERQIKAFNEQQDKTYQNIVNDIKKQTVDIIEQVATESKEVIIADFKNMTSAFQNQISAQYQKDYAAVQAEINDYKEKLKEDLKTRSVQILQEVAKRVFGKVIPIEDHEELIVKALEEAKKQHVI